MAEKHYGGTMRLGAYPAVLKKGTAVEKAYGRRIFPSVIVIVSRSTPFM